MTGEISCEDTEASCSFFLPKKNRTCSGRVVHGSRFCGNHGSSNSGKRVPCPLDLKHTVLESDLASHLKKCPSAKETQLLENQTFYSKGVNSQVPNVQKVPEDLTAKQRRARILSLSEEDFSSLMQRINNVHDEEVQKKLIFKPSILKPTEFDKFVHSEIERGIPFSEKHALQQASIVANMERFELCSRENVKAGGPVIVEFGAGRGYLSQLLCDFLGHKNFVLVDRKGFKFKADRTLRKSENVHIERVRVDIADLELKKLSYLHGKKFVGISKHLCGVATDLTLRCCTSVLKQPSQSLHGKEIAKSPYFGGLAIATCCHHLCSWSSFSNPGFFDRLGFTPTEFEIISWLTSWALSGNVTTDASNELSTSPSKRHRSNDQEHPPASRKNFLDDQSANFEPKKPVVWSKLTVYGRKEVGLKCKALIDAARLEHLKSLGLKAEIVEYIETSVSPENKLLLAKQN